MGKQTRDDLKHYINGKWTSPSCVDSIPVLSPSTEEVIGWIPQGTPEDVDAAVASARKASGSWACTTIDERAACLARIADGITRREEDIATLIALEMGAPLPFARSKHVAGASATIRAYIKALREMRFAETIENSLVVWQPLGVVGCITPWNFPLLQIAMKVPAALAAGCTTILKPSVEAPLTAYVLAEIMDEAGIPAGVFNLVGGIGTTVGEAIAAHAAVDMISLTGSAAAGRRVMELASKTLKRVSLELGGKSANIILPDLSATEFRAAVEDGTRNCFFNSGQGCGLLTRMLVPDFRKLEAERIAKETAAMFIVGDPFSSDAHLGPVVSYAQREQIRRYIRKGIDEGAKLLIGGVEPPEGLTRGYYVRPTVFTDVDRKMTIAQEEIFGPVLSIIPYRDEDEAVEIANDSVYGLLGRVWSASADRAKSIALRVNAGQVNINRASPNLLAPRGGHKQSGIGCELGRYGIAEFLQMKAINLEM